MTREQSRPELSAADYEKILSTLPEIYLLRDLSALPDAMLRIVTGLIPNLFCSYNELDHNPQNVVLTCRPAEWRERMAPYMAAGSQHMRDHPVYDEFLQAREFVPRAISDFLPEEEWRKTGFANALMNPLGIADTLMFRLNTGSASLIFIGINRATWGFSPRDRQIAHLLQSHFSAAYENAAAFTNARERTLVTHPTTGDNADSGVVVIDAKGKILHTNGSALQLIGKYFQSDIWGGALPPAVESWLSRDGSVGLPVSTRGEDRLLIRWSWQGNGSRILLLEEQAAQAKTGGVLSFAGLSPREAEVLHWIAEGKTNAEIGRILSISVRTVEKHVETVYRKLGVENRMGAILRVLSKP